jgi:ribose transport system substrate-binding protein
VSAMIKWLLQSGIKVGTAKGSIYTTLNTVTKANVDGACWTLGK